MFDLDLIKAYIKAAINADDNAKATANLPNESYMNRNGLHFSPNTNRVLLNREPLYDDLARINEYVSDTEIIKEFSGVDFVNDDFFCSCCK